MSVASESGAQRCDDVEKSRVSADGVFMCTEESETVPLACFRQLYGCGLLQWTARGTPGETGVLAT